MNILKLRIAAIVFSAAMLLSSCSITEFFDPSSILENETEENENLPEITEISSLLTVAGYAGEQISPYTSESRANRDIVSLCYDALIDIDSSFNAVAQICDYFEISGNKAVFHIDQTALFSDGSHVSAADCVYSFSKAEDPSSVYHNRFETITDYQATDTYTFTVTFSTDNIYNINLASIPIIKAGSDAYSAIPRGSGSYVFNSDEGGLFLTANKYAKNPPATERIEILAVNNSEELLYNVNYGNIHASYADLSGGNSSFRGTIELIDFTTNNLIFAVVNKNKEYFASVDAVKGITYAIDRSDMVSNILSSSSRGVWYPFNPDWHVTASSDLNTDIYSSTTAHEYFTAAGLTLSGTERVWDGEPSELVILVNQESLIKTEVAESIAKNLISMGFKATVRTLKWDEMQQAVLDGEYDIFIAEMNIFPNMDISSVTNNELILSAAGLNEYGDIGYSESYTDAAEAFYSGKTDMRTFLSAFQEELPFIPLYFSGGALAMNRNISGEFAPNCFDLYAKAETWTIE